MDFSSKSFCLKQGFVLEDAISVVLHKDDLGNRICVLAIEGYGEVSPLCDQQKLIKNTYPGDDGINAVPFHGNKMWKDSLGGETVCCSRCCAKLGFAPIENDSTVRLFKHRLRTDPGSFFGFQRSSIFNSFKRNTCASFLAHEMVRYAETYGVFTFEIAVPYFGTTELAAESGESHRQSFLVLKILSWDNRIASTEYFKGQVEKVNGYLHLEFVTVVKVFYEITDKIRHSNIEVPTMSQWSAIDFCCLPEEDKAFKGKSTSSVRIYLPDEEWKELHDTLKDGKRFFSDSMSKLKATLKAPFLNSDNRNLGQLSVLHMADPILE